MNIKPFTPLKILEILFQEITHNKKAKDGLEILFKHLYCIAPELRSNRFWYGCGRCFGLIDILSENCTNKNDTPEIIEENKKIIKLYNEILEYYNKNGFDKI